MGGGVDTKSQQMIFILLLANLFFLRLRFFFLKHLDAVLSLMNLIHEMISQCSVVVFKAFMPTLLHHCQVFLMITPEFFAHSIDFGVLLSHKSMKLFLLAHNLSFLVLL